MVSIEIERNPLAARVVGKYKSFGGDPSKPVTEGEECPCCGGAIEESKYIGFVYCGACEWDYAMFLTIKDPKVASVRYLEYFEEVRSNEDLYTKFLDLKDTYRHVWLKYVAMRQRINFFSRFSRTYMFKLWKQYIKKYDITPKKDPDDIVKYRVFPTYAINEFLNFCKTDPFWDDEGEIVSISTSKKDLIDKMVKLEEENFQLKDRLKEYGLL
jgi:hypothetical protein